MSNKELVNFMNKKRNFSVEEKDEKEETIIDKSNKNIKIVEGKENIEAAKALAKLRALLNLLLIIPLVLTVVMLFAYILIEFLPSVLVFLKFFIGKLIAVE